MTNIGTVPLGSFGSPFGDSIAVIDDQGVAVSCPQVSLEPGESMTCTGSGTVIEGAYTTWRRSPVNQWPATACQQATRR